MAEVDREDAEGEKVAPKKAQEVLTEAKKRFQRAVESDDEQRKLRAEDLKFLAGNSDNNYQWPDYARRERERAKGGPRPMLTENRLPQHVRQVTNDQRQNRPAIKVRAVDDKGDIRVAEILNDLVRHIENNKNEVYSGANSAITTACEAQVSTGLGYFAIATDYVDDESFDQDIFFRRIRNAFTIYDDPDIQSLDGRDRKWLIESVMMDEDEFKSTYPDAAPVDWAFVTAAGDGAQWYVMAEKKVRVAKYWRVEEEQAWLCLMPDGTTVRSKKKLKDAEQCRRVNEREVYCYTLTGNEVLDVNEWPGRYIPFCRVVGNEFDIDGKVEVSGLVRNAKDPQRMANYWVSAEAEALGVSIKAPWVGYIESIAGHEKIWNTANQINWNFLPVNAVTEGGALLPLPVRQPPALPQAGYIEAKQGAIDAIKSVTGQYDASLGQKSNETSGKAIMNRQRESDTANFHYLDNLSFAIEFAGQIILDLIPRIYDTQRVARIIGEDGTQSQVMVNPELEQAMAKIVANGKQMEVVNFNVGKYDVVVSTGPSFTTKRQEAGEAIIQLSQANPAFAAATADMMPNLLDLPYADELQKRLRAVAPPQVQQVLAEDDGQEPLPPQAIAVIEQAKQALGQAHGQMDAMQQALQQKEQELAQAREQAGVVDQMLAQAKTEAESLKLESLRVEKAAEVRIAELRVAEAELKLALSQQQAEHSVQMAAHDAGMQQAQAAADMETKASEQVESAEHEANEEKVQDQLLAALATVQQQLADMQAAQAAKPREMLIKGSSGRTFRVAMGDDGNAAIQEA